ncbi:hypothetical protein J6590_012017 [Homalodisca vitripennis]|nr:hypothetical protein J6590_012017 [Homalodisca vitripennis]
MGSSLIRGIMTVFFEAAKSTQQVQQKDRQSRKKCGDTILTANIVMFTASKQQRKPRMTSTAVMLRTLMRFTTLTWLIGDYVA